MKTSTRVGIVAVVLAAVGLSLFFTTTSYDWNTPFGGQPSASFDETLPPFVVGGEPAEFPPECGDDFINAGSAGPYGISGDFQHQAQGSIAVVEGKAKVAGPAVFGEVTFTPGMEKSKRLDAASGITTPFTIDVNRTHYGEDRSEWNVSQYGGRVGCASYTISASSIFLFDGAEGLFFIRPYEEERTGNLVTLAVVEKGPMWYYFAESENWRIEEAVATVTAINR